MIKEATVYARRSHGGCESGSGTPATTRNRYFTGKPMTARDFADEQRFLIERHRLHNRLLHDWGIVCGLRVKHHRNPDCQDRWVVVEAGIAIDCCGREIILARDTTVRIDGDDGSEQAAAQRRDTDPWEPPEDLVVYVRYAEELEECVPVLYREHGCDPTESEAGRVREVAELGMVPFADLPPGCWRQPGGWEDTPCQKGCDDDPWESGGCLEPHCPCGTWVPLARLTDTGCENDELPRARFRIDDSGVWRISPRSQHLTRITAINWPHGGEMPINQLQRDGLRVRFDRRLAEAGGDATGVNRFTFMVQYSESQEDLSFVTPATDSPSFEPETCTAVFMVEDDLFRARRGFADSDIYISLRCDFLLDCNGVPVDGDHIGGRLPSGNGIAGGVFDSWFRLVHGHASK